MEYFDNIDWRFIWHIVRDTVLPHTGTLIWYTLLFIFIGFIISIIYLVFLHKKKILKRKPKYYNWVVKLYIPILLVGYVFFFGEIGLITGIYKVLNKENNTIVTSIYDTVLAYTFDSEKSKNEFIIELQQSAIELKDGSNVLVASLKITTEEYNTGYSIIDSGKDKVAVYLIDKYGDDIYKISVYAMLNAAGARAHVDINESLPYEEFSKGMDFLLDVGHNEIELAIKEKLSLWLDTLIYNQYKSIIISQLILLLILSVLPLVEFLIYKKWVEPKYLECSLDRTESNKNQDVYLD